MAFDARALISGVAILTSLAGAAGAANTVETVASPDGRLTVTFTLDGGAPRYAVSYDGRAVIEPSALGFTFRSQAPLTGGFTLAATARIRVPKGWQARPASLPLELAPNKPSSATVELVAPAAVRRAVRPGGPGGPCGAPPARCGTGATSYW